MCFYFQFVSKEKKTCQEIRCFIQDYSGELGGAKLGVNVYSLFSFHTFHVSPYGEGASDKATLPASPGNQGLSCMDAAGGDSLGTPFWMTEGGTLQCPPPPATSRTIT